MEEKLENLNKELEICKKNRTVGIIIFISGIAAMIIFNQLILGIAGSKGAMFELFLTRFPSVAAIITGLVKTIKNGRSIRKIEADIKKTHEDKEKPEELDIEKEKEEKEEEVKKDKTTVNNNAETIENDTIEQQLLNPEVDYNNMTDVQKLEYLRDQIDMLLAATNTQEQSEGYQKRK